MSYSLKEASVITGYRKTFDPRNPCFIVKFGGSGSGACSIEYIVYGKNAKGQTIILYKYWAPLTTSGAIFYEAHRVKFTGSIMNGSITPNGGPFFECNWFSEQYIANMSPVSTKVGGPAIVCCDFEPKPGIGVSYNCGGESHFISSAYGGYVTSSCSAPEGAVICGYGGGIGGCNGGGSVQAEQICQKSASITHGPLFNTVSASYNVSYGPCKNCYNGGGGGGNNGGGDHDGPTPDPGPDPDPKPVPPQPPIDPTPDPIDKDFGVAVGANACGGTVTPKPGFYPIKAGGSFSVSASADSGKVIKTAIVDGAEIDCTTSFSYNFSNINENHTVNVTFLCDDETGDGGTVIWSVDETGV